MHGGAPKVKTRILIWTCGSRLVSSEYLEDLVRNLTAAVLNTADVPKNKQIMNYNTQDCDEINV